MDKPNPKCPRCESINTCPLTCKTGCKVCIESWICLDDCGHRWHKCVSSGNTLKRSGQGHFECDACASFGDEKKFREARGAYHKLKSTVDRRLGCRCPQCGGMYWDRSDVRGMSVQTCEECAVSWHVCAVTNVMTAVLEGEPLECKSCAAEDDTVKCAGCKSGRISWSPCSCGIQCNHFVCTQCATRWHRCKDSKPAQLVPAKTLHVNYCSHCINPWNVARNPISGVRESAVPKVTTLRSKPKARACAKVPDTSKDSKPASKPKPAPSPDPLEDEDEDEDDTADF